MTSMPTIQWVLYVLIGFIAGATGKGIRSGTVGSIIIGVLGAVVGGNILSWLGLMARILGYLGLVEYQVIVSLIMAAAGAVLFLYVARVIRGD